jgi:hypothetical protein
LLQPRRTRSADYFDHYNKKGATWN